MRVGSKMHKQVLEYTLSDYEFLQDYEILESRSSSKSAFVAQIKNSSQKVRFLKKKFSEELFPRFKVLAKLYKSGIVLADNMFIIEECEQHYLYVIQAELEVTNRRFRSLQQYLYQENPTEEERKAIVGKIKILTDCLHQEGHAYAGLDVRCIIVDDQNHIYLAPFPLEPEFKTDYFSRAYYPPELLAKIQAGSSQIDEASMMRWDFWSFGCIIAEILFYRTPLFLDTSLRKQMKRIKHFAFIDELQNLEEAMKNVITNSLNRDETARSISQTQVTRTKNAENQNDLKKTVKNWKKTYKQGNNEDLTELNLNKDDETGDSQLVIHLITLEGINFKDELHVVVGLNKKYHFYVDSSKEGNRYKLNKLITIRNSFTEFSKMLEQPIKIQAREGASKTILFINLQSLVMMHEGRRIWNKQLLGTYKAEKDSSCPQAKLKISCVLNSPEFFVQDIPKPVQNKEQNQKINQPLLQLQTALTDISNTVAVPKKRRQKASSKCEIPSISEISKSISSITQHFMKKLSSGEQARVKESPIKEKIERMLDL